MYNSHQYLFNIRKISLITIFSFVLLSSTLISVVPFNAKGSSEIRNELSNSSSTNSVVAESQSKSQQEESRVRQERSGNLQSKEVMAPENKEQKKKNHLPTANAGPDVTVNEGQEVMLNAKRSNDVDGDDLSFDWTQISPRNPVIDVKDGNSDSASFVAPRIDTRPLILTFSLTVQDGNGGTDRDVIRVKVNNLLQGQKNSDEVTPSNKDKPSQDEVKSDDLSPSPSVTESEKLAPRNKPNNSNAEKLQHQGRDNGQSAGKSIGQVQANQLPVPLPPPPSGGDGGYSASWSHPGWIYSDGAGFVDPRPAQHSSASGQLKLVEVLESGTRKYLPTGIWQVSCTLDGNFGVQSYTGPVNTDDPSVFDGYDKLQVAMPTSLFPTGALRHFGFSFNTPVAGLKCGAGPPPQSLFFPNTQLQPSGVMVSKGSKLATCCPVDEDPTPPFQVFREYHWDIIIHPIASQNIPPTANPQSVSTIQDTPKSITLTGSDPEDDSLSFTPTQQPGHGTLIITGPSSVTYIPEDGYVGDDEFQFKVNDGKADSNPAKVSITIQPKPNIALTVGVDKQEINPYPVNNNPPKPQTGITITTKNTDGTPAMNVDVEVKACTQVGVAAADGHIHDTKTSDACFQSTRPKATLTGDTQTGNPILVKTDDKGTAKIKYTPPSSQNKYYISGKDIIVATLKQDSTVKDDSKTITTRVPNLKQIANSQTCPGGTDAYYFEAQSKHGCLFYGTENANTELVKIAEAFKQRQIECAKARNPRDVPACDVTPPGGNEREKLFAKITGDPIPIKITAMGLPWGGLLDINGNWNPPHQTHNDGKNVDVGFNVKGSPMNLDQKRMLRDVIIDSGHLLPYSGEGKEPDASKAVNHYHIQFISCDSNTAGTLKAQALSSCNANLVVKGKIFVNTPDRKNMFLPNVKVELCSSSPPSFACTKSVTTDTSGKFQLETDKILEKDAQLKFSLEDLENKIYVTKHPNVLAPSVLISNMIFAPDPISGERLADLNIQFQDKAPFASINGKPSTSQSNTISITNVDEPSITHLAAIYYYSDRALTFSKSNIPIAQTYKMPLEVKAFSSHGSSLDDSGSHIVLHLEPGDSRLGGFTSAIQTETELDVLFHELGHFLDSEFLRGRDFRNPTLDSVFQTADPTATANCHEGYGQVDSSCALNEAKATFYGLVLADRTLDGLTHTIYKFHASQYIVSPTDIKNMERPSATSASIVGPRIPAAGSPFFQHSSLAEEFALASLLWDLYDHTPAEDPAELPFNNLINSLIFSRTTFSYYQNLVGLIPAVKPSIDEVFRSFSIYVDKNHNGKYEPGEVDGRSAWQALVNGNVFGTLYSTVPPIFTGRE